MDEHAYPQHFREAAQRARSNENKENKENKEISGNDAFLLWSTYGFPLDLTQLMAAEQGLVVDVPGYNTALGDAREKSRSSLATSLKASRKAL